MFGKMIENPGGGMSKKSEKSGFEKVKIPEWDTDFRADRSSGAGGQNVNKTATKITLKFDVNGSKTLNDEQKKIILKELANYINKQGEVVIYEQSTRSQLSNREEAMRKLNEMINRALEPKTERRATKEPTRVKEGVLASKKKRSETKKSRGKVYLD